VTVKDGEVVMILLLVDLDRNMMCDRIAENERCMANSKEGKGCVLCDAQKSQVVQFAGTSRRKRNETCV
jgi:hypothetical protein